jgi:CHAD domain-containing protein
MDSAAPLLDRPPEEGARRIALGYLDDAVEAWPRLSGGADSDDPEALHDFRVALRRLRSCLRSYRPYLKDGLSKKLERRLRDLAGATGPGRDTEVQIAWLRDAGRDLGQHHRAALAWLLGRLEERMNDATEDLEEPLSEFPSLERGLRRRLSTYRTEVHLDSGGGRPTLGEAAAAALRKQLSELEIHLAHVEDPGDEEQAHRARNSAKRLRYLIEPLAGEVPGSKPAVQALKVLQDLLGELHDAHVLETELVRALEESAAERAHRLLGLALADAPDEKLLRNERRRVREAGLIALARQNRDRRDRLFTLLEEGWLEGRAAEALARIEELAVALASREVREEPSPG